MYKVFFNESLLTFDIESRPEAKNILFHHESQFDEAFHLLSNSDVKHINIFSDDIKEVWEKFTNYFKVIKAAGGIVRNNLNQILFIYRLGKWDLPKGKIEEGESIEESAIREIEEECSITSLEINHFLIPTYHIYYQKEYIIKETFWFDVQYNGTKEPQPQIEEGIEKVIWVNENEIAKLMENSYPNIKLLVDQYL